MTSKPIRWSLWVLGLATAAVAIALAGRYGLGFVVFVVSPWRIEHGDLCGVRGGRARRAAPLWCGVRIIATDWLRLSIAARTESDEK